MLLFIFWTICCISLWKYKEQLFQVKSRIIILSLLGIEFFFVMSHYSLGLPSEYAIIFVIIQEFFKISAFLYCIFFYLKQAIDFTDEERGRKFIKILKITLSLFWIIAGIVLFIWAILRISKFITEYPCKDKTWLMYRIITLILVISTITAGVIIQRRVTLRTVNLYGEDRRNTNSSERK